MVLASTAVIFSQSPYTHDHVLLCQDLWLISDQQKMCARIWTTVLIPDGGWYWQWHQDTQLPLRLIIQSVQNCKMAV
jgi:hypothetical protein